VNEAIFSRVRQLLGERAIERDSQGRPRAVPDSTDGVASVITLANQEGWQIRLEGHGTWLPPDAPADLVLSLKGLEQVLSFTPADLVATVEAGVAMDSLRRHLGGHGMWLGIDPPGRSDRTIGSVIATGTSGPLRLGLGPVRDHVLGCTVVTGDGQVVRAGGRVVKNVAGFDLTKLQVGGFGGFGVITELHLRLRALPRTDTTLIARGTRDDLLVVARAIRESTLLPAAMELLSPALAADAAWVLAVRLLGPEEAVAADQHQLGAVETSVTWDALSPERSSAFWTLAALACLSGSVTLRLGALSAGLDETLDLLGGELNEGLVAAGAGEGTIRWSGEASPSQLLHLRRAAATREIPLTLERAPWSVRVAVGHFGAYREGVGQLVDRLRKTYDPAPVISVALEGTEHE
jgi:FAD/FMN-containing dehydrogenase